ncbi:MAG: translation initiation factor [Bdellovibrionota bacterium]
MSDFKPKLVWSDDPKDKAKVEDRKGRGPEAPEATDEFIHAKKWTAVFRIETGSRGGKTVTVIDRLPRQEKFVRDLTKELKAKCGTGGTHVLGDEYGVIEIQGDKRKEIKAIFDKKGFLYKGM